MTALLLVSRVLAMRPAAWVWVGALPLLAFGCADLIGIGDLPPLPSNDASTDRPEDDTSEREAGEGAPKNDAPAGIDAGDGGEATLSLSPGALHLVQGTSGAVTVNVIGARTETDAITVTGLPAGVTAGPLAIPASAKSGSLVLTAATVASLGPANVSVAFADGSKAPLELFVAGPTGSYDTTFGSGGGVVTHVPSSGTTGASAASVAMLADGSFIVGGALGSTPDSGWALVHVLSDGSIDASFPAQAMPITGHVTAVALGPTSGPLADTILVAGTSQQCGGTTDEASLYILTKTGAPYRAFNGNGLWCESLDAGPGGSASAGAAATPTGFVNIATNSGSSGLLTRVDSMGNTASGWSFTGLPAYESLVGLFVDGAGNAIVAGGRDNQFLALRYLATGGGSPDPSFLGGGGLFGDASAILNAQTSALDPDGGVWIGGFGAEYVAVLGHVNAAGRVDVGGDAGTVVDDIDAAFSLGYQSLASMSDGRLLGTGNGVAGAGSLPWIARVTTSGQLDPTFNADAGASPGYFLYPSTTGVTFNAVAVAPPPDGRIVIVGGEPGSGMYFLRIWP